MATKTATKRGRPKIAEQFPPPPEGAVYLTILEVSHLLRVSDDTVRRMIDGTDDDPPVLDSVRIVGSRRIPKAALDAYLEAQTVKAGTTKVSKKAAKRFDL